MAKTTFVFRRTELKYRISRDACRAFLTEMMPTLTPDQYGKSTLSSLYLDSPDRRLISASMEGKRYKEKLRVRAYGKPTEESPVFLELKKKYLGVVYKRRIVLPHREVMSYLHNESALPDGQIAREIDYFKQFHGPLSPAMVISCERVAYYAKDDPTLRITVDTAIRYRTDRLSLTEGSDGTPIIGRDEVLMEIKAAGALPLEMVACLNRLKIYPAPFSKYATAYKTERGVLPKLHYNVNEGDYIHV